MNDAQTRAALIEAMACAIGEAVGMAPIGVKTPRASDLMRAEAALAAIEAHAGGCRVVPVEATAKMLRAGMRYLGETAFIEMHRASPYAPEARND